MTSPSASDDPRLADALAATTLELVQIPSVTGDEQALADHLEARLRRLEPAKFSRTAHGLVVQPTSPRADRPTIGLFGHLDTVPPREDGPPRRDAETVYGPGASDMKAGLAVMVELLERLDFERLGVDVTAVFYTAEEGPYEQSGLTPLLDAVPAARDIDLAFCLEPSDNRVQLGAVGTLHCTVTFEGRRAHSARPWQGENAVHKAGPLLNELLARPPREVTFGAGLTYREVLSATMVAATGARNVVPDRFELNLNYRFAPGRSIAAAQAEVEALVGGQATIEWTDLCPSGPVATDHPLLQPLLADPAVPVEAKQAWTDVARLALYGIAAVNLGPGEAAQAHQQNERCRIDLIAAGYRLFERYLTDLHR